MNRLMLMNNLFPVAMIALNLGRQPFMDYAVITQKAIFQCAASVLATITLFM